LTKKRHKVLEKRKIRERERRTEADNKRGERGRERIEEEEKTEKD
jgi:hypothetical protein